MAPLTPSIVEISQSFQTIGRNGFNKGFSYYSRELNVDSLNNDSRPLSYTTTMRLTTISSKSRTFAKDSLNQAACVMAFTLALSGCAKLTEGGNNPGGVASELEYSANPANYTYGAAITPNTPVTSKTIESLFQRLVLYIYFHNTVLTK